MRNGAGVYGAEIRTLRTKSRRKLVPLPVPYNRTRPPGWNVPPPPRYSGDMMAHLALQTTVPADTMVTIAARDGVDYIVALAAGSIAALCIFVLLGLVLVAWQVRNAIHALEQARRDVAADPAVRSLRKIAENVESISDAVTGEALKLTDSVSKISDRLTHAADRMEERVEEFNALMEVVQHEAENAFVDSASTARGVRTGLDQLRGDRRRASGRDGARRPGRATGVVQTDPARDPSPEEPASASTEAPADPPNGGGTR